MTVPLVLHKRFTQVPLPPHLYRSASQNSSSSRLAFESKRYLTSRLEMTDVNYL